MMHQDMLCTVVHRKTEVQVCTAMTWGQSGEIPCDERLQAPWTAWQEHMTQLFRDFLVPAPAKVIWKEHAPQHHEGDLGINIKYLLSLGHLPALFCSLCSPDKLACAKAEKEVPKSFTI